MDPVRTCIALGPICAYFLVLTTLNLSKRAFVTSGARDLLALCVAIAGLIVVGPMELFMPERSAAYFGAWIWLPLIALYLLLALLGSMIARPRIVVYNITADQLRPVLGSVVNELDSDVRWAGESLTMPNLRIQLFVQGHPGMKNVQLVAGGGEQNLLGWKRLEKELKQALKDVTVGGNPRGFSFLIVAVFAVCGIGYSLLRGRAEIAELVQEFLRL